MKNVNQKKIMNKKRLSIIIFGLVILFACSREETVYTLKSYYPDRKVTDISEYVIRNGDTVFHGKFIQYNEKGNKIAEGNFVDNEPYGKSIYYFDNGNIESIHYRKNSKITVENIQNYPNGNIKRYMLYDDLGIPDFSIHYDEQGNVENYKGLPLIEIYQYKIANKERFNIKVNQFLKVGDTLKHKYLIANIPNAKQNLKIKLIDPDLLGYKSKIIKKPPVEVNAADVLTKKGVYSVKAVVEYKFNDNKKTVIKDSIYFEVNVN